MRSRDTETQACRVAEVCWNRFSLGPEGTGPFSSQLHVQQSHTDSVKLEVELRWKYLHHGNQPVLQISTFYPPLLSSREPVVKYSPAHHRGSVSPVVHSHVSSSTFGSLVYTLRIVCYVSSGSLRSTCRDGMKHPRILLGRTLVREKIQVPAKAGRAIRLWYKSDPE